MNTTTANPTPTAPLVYTDAELAALLRVNDGRTAKAMGKVIWRFTRANRLKRLPGGGWARAAVEQAINHAGRE